MWECLSSFVFRFVLFGDRLMPCLCSILDLSLGCIPTSDRVPILAIVFLLIPIITRVSTLFSRHYARISRLFRLNVQSLRFLSLVFAQLLIFTLISFVFCSFCALFRYGRSFCTFSYNFASPFLMEQWLFVSLTWASPLCASISSHDTPWHIK